MAIAEAAKHFRSVSSASTGEGREWATSGQLQDAPARHLIDHLNQTAFTGTLLLRHKDKKKKLWFYEGEVFRIQSNLVPELLGRMMIDRGWLNEADLRTCLKIQRELLDRGASTKKIGELVAEVHGLDEDEIHCLVEQQCISSFLQATTWEQGEYELVDLELKTKPEQLFRLGDVVSSLHSLFEVTPSTLGPVFEQLEVWHPTANSVELSRTPLWMILAGCRRLGLSGIISVRRQNKLYEIVLKYGIPLTLYEGTFGQPRQTIVVRQASEDHEKFFIEQLFKLFSFLTGSVHFRNLGDSRSAQEDSDSQLQFRDETAVTKSVSSHESFVELHRGLFSLRYSWRAYSRKLKTYFYHLWKNWMRLVRR